MYPNFTFVKHKGYGTKAHKEELSKFGPTPLHRYSFKPVRIAHEELLERQN
jgi:ribonuclease HII